MEALRYISLFEVHYRTISVVPVWRMATLNVPPIRMPRAGQLYIMQRERKCLEHIRQHWPIQSLLQLSIVLGKTMRDIALHVAGREELPSVCEAIFEYFQFGSLNARHAHSKFEERVLTASKTLPEYICNQSICGQLRPT